MKVSELDGAQLDYWVAKAEGYNPELQEGRPYIWTDQTGFWLPSVNWSDGGPIIEREQIQIGPTYDGWYAEYPYMRRSGVSAGYGDPFVEAKTALIAAMRCYVASKFG